jgi:uncharacterized protein (TIGR02391 family)
MTRLTVPPEPPVQPREWRSVEEIDRAIAKLGRRIADLESLDVHAAYRGSTGADRVVISDIRDTIRDVFGPHSPEFQEHQHIGLLAGGLWMNMTDDELRRAHEGGKSQTIAILKGLVARLGEKREDFDGVASISPSGYLRYLNLHPRIADVASDLLSDGYAWEAVFAASKALVNYVKERSGRHELDGTGLMRTVFSKNNPILAFNELADQTDLDEQEGMMHLFEGVVLGVRNPGGHAFPEGPKQRAIEYLSLISLLAFRVQEATRRRPAANE